MNTLRKKQCVKCTHLKTVRNFRIGSDICDNCQKKVGAMPKLHPIMQAFLRNNAKALDQQ